MDVILKYFFYAENLEMHIAFGCLSICWFIYHTCHLVKNAYGKCPKNSNTKVSDKMTYANSAGPDQTAAEGAV